MRLSFFFGEPSEDEDEEDEDAESEDTVYTEYYVTIKVASAATNPNLAV